MLFRFEIKLPFARRTLNSSALAENSNLTLLSNEVTGLSVILSCVPAVP